MDVAESAVSDGVIQKQRFQRLQQARGQSLEDYVTTFTEALKRLQLLKVKTEPVDTIYKLDPFKPGPGHLWSQGVKLDRTRQDS